MFDYKIITFDEAVDAGLTYKFTSTQNHKNKTESQNHRIHIKPLNNLTLYTLYYRHNTYTNLNSSALHHN